MRDATIRHCEKKYGYVCKVGTKAYCALRSAITKAVDYLAKKHYKEDNIEVVEGITFDEYKKRWLAIGKEFKDTYLSGNDFVENDDLTDEEKEELEEQERADFAQKLIGASLTPEQQEICDYYPLAVGQFTQIGQHACGMIISKDRLDDALPMYYNSARDNWQTQMTYPQAEALGYLKMDMLGLVTLDICNEIEQQTGDFVDLETVLNSPATYEVMRSGKTEGIFQMNGKRIAAHMRDDLRPDCIEDIVGENALNRPGPWDTFHEDYAKRKHDKDYKGENSIDTSYSEALTKILEPTYGCLLYQEQVMEIFRQLAGYTMGAADNVRRIMGKKKTEKIAAEKPKFVEGTEGWIYNVEYLDSKNKKKSFTLTVSGDTKEESQTEISKLWQKNHFADYAEDVVKPVSITVKEAYVPGCIRNGVPRDKAEELFDIMAEFAKYAFNKSHSVAYAVLACRTAYHKAKHLPIFYAATMNYQNDPKKMRNILNEMVTSVTLIPPRLSNHSYRFRGDEKNNTVAFGVCGIKGFGESMKDVPIRYASNIYEFCVINPDIPKDNLESLIKVGFFDEWGFTRQALLNAVPTILKETAKTAEPDPEFDFYEEKVYPILRESLLENQSAEEAFENLSWENELMNVSTSVGTGIQIIKSHRNTRPYDGEAGWFNFAVAACAPPRTTKSGNTFYEATLVDSNGNFITRRFSEPITSISIRAYVNDDDHKYFITNCSKQPIEHLTKLQYNVDIAAVEQLAKKLIKTTGQNLLAVFKQEQTEEYCQKVIADATGEVLYVRPEMFDELKRHNLLYEADFKKMVATR